MKIGFVGVGNMGGAILRGYLSTKRTAASDIFAAGKHPEKLKKLEAELGITACADIPLLVAATDVILLGVKPNLFEEILPQVAEKYTRDKVVVSMAAGVSIAFIEQYLGDDAKIVRIMPNTPAMIGQAMTSVSRNKNVGDELFAQVFELFTAIGKAEEIAEELIHCVIGVSGSSPAYTYMYIEALAKAAVKNGMEEEQAVTFAAQAVLGAAKMVLETGIDPVQLRINVCSPGGTTVEAVDTLFENGFVDDVTEAFQAAMEKSKKMTK